MIDLKQALLDPQSVFKKPDEVLSASALSRDQKIEILRRWAYEAQELAVAEEENMSGASRASMFDEISAALHTLGAPLDPHAQ